MHIVSFEKLVLGSSLLLPLLECTYVRFNFLNGAPHKQGHQVRSARVITGSQPNTPLSYRANEEGMVDAYFKDPNDVWYIEVNCDEGIFRGGMGVIEDRSSNLQDRIPVTVTYDSQVNYAKV